MNRSIPFCAAALFLVACGSEPTSPSTLAHDDLAPSFAKKPGNPAPTVSGNLQNNVFAFAADGLGASGSTQTTLEVQDQNSQAISALRTEEMPAKPGNYVLGRLNNEQVVIGIKAGATRYELKLDFYAIGSWDGRGQQAQKGSFGQDTWSVSAQCGDSVVDIFTTSFSNQKAVQQHYPSTLSGKPSQWLTNSAGSDVTGFDAIVPQFSSVKDAWYQLSFTGGNPCGSKAFTAIRLFNPGFTLQSRSDEAWAVDNISLKTDNN